MITLYVILLIIVPTLTLAVMFGIGWPLLEVANQKLARWDNVDGVRKIVWGICIVLIAGFGIGAAIFDVVVNYTESIRRRISGYRLIL